MSMSKGMWDTALIKGGNCLKTIILSPETARQCLRAGGPEAVVMDESNATSPIREVG